MTAAHLIKNKGPFNAIVKTNKQTGKCFYTMYLEFEGQAAKAFAETIPGQFAEFDLRQTSLPNDEQIPDELKDKCKRDIILRRPFSFCSVETDGDKTIVEILYCVVGPASLRMTTLKAGDKVSVIGPLGNGFSIPEGKKTALLVAGGMGSPPVQHLANVLTRNYPKTRVVMLAGAKTKDDFPFDPNKLTKDKVEPIITTDDGSLGLKGLVTEHLEKWLDEKHKNKSDIIIYSCGPEEMLAKVAETANERNIDCQISMERRMACGFGVCQGCAVECRVASSNQTAYKMCCTDGPVFDSKELVFSY